MPNPSSLTLNPFEAYWLAFDPDKTNSTEVKPDITTKEKLVNTTWRISYPNENTVYKTTAKVLYSDSRLKENEFLRLGYDDSNWKYYSRQDENNIKKHLWLLENEYSGRSKIGYSSILYVGKRNLAE